MVSEKAMMCVDNLGQNGVIEVIDLFFYSESSVSIANDSFVFQAKSRFVDL